MGPECPNCREPLPRLRLFLTTAWGRWECSSCGALLGVNKRRRFLATIPWALYLFFVLGVVRITNYGMPVAIPVIMVAGFLNFMLFDRAVVYERTGLRCHDCGYDLKGQVEPRCPECGRVLDDEQAARLASGGMADEPRPVRRGLWFRDWGVIIAASLLVLATIGLLVYTRSQRAAGPGPAPATVPVPAPAPAPVDTSGAP